MVPVSECSGSGPSQSFFGGMMKKLTPRQQAALKRHSVHHTAKHMSEMRKAMRSGKTFTEAHRMAMRRVGK